MPVWSLPKDCPNCRSELSESSENEIPRPTIGYQNGKTDYGEFNQAVCCNCGLILDRTYPDESSANDSDPFCSPEDWVYRAHALELETALKRRESQVAALKEQGLKHPEIADKLGIAESTIGEYSRRINGRLDRAVETIIELDNRYGFVDIIERDLEEFSITPVDHCSCLVCEDKLTAGDRATVLFEQLEGHWERKEVYCQTCDEEEYKTVVHNKIIPLTEFIHDSPGRFVIIEGLLSKINNSGAHSSIYDEPSLKISNVELTSFHV